MSDEDITDVEIAAFRAVWREVADLPYGPARVSDYDRWDGTVDLDGLRAADREADRLNDDLIRRALVAVRAARRP